MCAGEGNGIEAEFQITDVVGSGVGHGLVGHPLDRLPTLVKAAQESELGQELVEIILPSGHLDIGAQFLDVIRGQVYAVLFGDIGQGLEAQRTLQMPVQVHLGHPLKEFSQFGQ